MSAGGQVLDNRELALLVWLAGGLLILCVVRKDLRRSVGRFLSTLLKPPVGVVLLSMLAYVALFIVLLAWLGLWTDDLISETGFWAAGPAFLLFLRVNEAGGDQDFFKKVLISTIGTVVVVEFVASLRPFWLALELALVPVLLGLGGVIAIGGAQAEHRQAKRAAEWLVALIVLAMVAYTVAGIISSPKEWLTSENLLELILPVILTVGFIPFLYVVALYLAYDSLFRHVDISLDISQRRKVARYAKRRAFRESLLRLSEAHRLGTKLPRLLTRESEKADVDRVLNEVDDDE